MPEVYDYALVVVKSDIDELRHANNLSYLKWMQAAAMAHSAAQGWPAERYHEQGAGWVVRSHQVQYKLPALVGEQVVVRTWVAGQKRVTSLRCYEILRPRDASTLAVAATEWAYVDFTTGFPKRIPAELRSAFTVLEQRVELPHLTAGWTKHDDRA